MDKISEMPLAFESVRSQLLREFPKENNKGLNTSRVENFIQSKGLKIKPYIIFYREDLPRVKETLSSILPKSVFNNDEGIYIQKMDMVLIARDRDLEESSGAIYTEGLLVHELAHASSMYQGYATADYKKYYIPRVGFSLPNNLTAWGWLLEEGWADMHRAEYFAQNASEKEFQKLKDALMFGEISMEDTIPIIVSGSKILPLPTKYLFIIPEGKPTTKFAAFAGYALELLCKRNPAIKNLMVEGRTSVEGLRKLAQAIEEIRPGLYKKLQSINYTEEDFSEGLSMMISDVAGSIENTIVAEGFLRNTWDHLLNK